MHAKPAARAASLDARYRPRAMRGLRAASLLDEAHRHYRKAISLAGHTVGTLDAHQALIEIYQASGQRLLAASESRRLKGKNVLGTFSPEVALERKGTRP